MDEHDKARPVSGEIMASDTDRGATPVRADFTDAEIVSVDTVAREAARPSPRAPVAEGMDLLKASKPEASGPRNPVHGGALFWATGLAMVGLAFWISGGHALVRQSFAPAAIETGEALRIGDVVTRVENRDGRDVLFIEGEARNHGDTPEAMRPIEISIVDNEGRATRYFLGTRADELAPGNRYAFSSRIEAPATGVKSVSVSLQEGIR